MHWYWIIKNTLPKEKEFDEESRKQLLGSTLAAVSPLPDGVKVIASLYTALIITLEGPENAIDALREAVIEKDLGTIERSKTVIQGA